MIKEKDVYKIGLFNKPHGIHGELSFTFTDDIFDRVDGEYFICLLDGILVPFFIDEYRFRSDSTALVKLEGVDTAEKARIFTNVEVFFPRQFQDEESNKAEDASWDYFLGFRVFDVNSGELGEITEIDDTTENVLFVITYKEKELLIPAQEELMRDLDKSNKTILFELPEGLLTLDD